MPLFVPVLLLGGSALVSALGLKKGYDGVSSMREAGAAGEQAEARHRRHLRLVDDARQCVNKDAERYGKHVLDVRTNTFGRLLRLLEQLKQRGGRDVLKLFESADVTHRVLADFRAQYFEAFSTVKGLAAAGAASAASMSATYSAVGLIGVASTGTAISGLSGAAATNATLAWLGGGSLAAGGFGMAGGMVVLGGIMAGPAIAITGFMFASQGEKALTKASEYVAKVDRAIADLDAVIAFLQKVQIRIREMDDLVVQLDQRLDHELGNLESEIATFSIKKSAHAKKLRATLALATALSEIMRTPVLTEDNELNLATASVLAKYRHLA